MVRSDYPFWKEVEDMNDGSMKCKFCGHLFANGTSISRIKWHFSGERGHGVGICGQVPKEVQEAAFLAMRGGNKRHKSIASSSNVDISTCPQEQNNAVLINLAQGVGPERIHSRLEAASGMEGSFQHVDRSVSPWRLRVDAHENRGEATQGTDLVDQFADATWVHMHSALSKEQQLNEISTYLMQEDETVARTEQVQHLERGSSCERPSINQADEPRGDSSQPTDPLCLDHGRYYDQLFAPSVNNDVVMYDVQNMVRVRTEPVEEEGVENSGRLVQPGAGARSSTNLKYNTSETRGVPLPTSSKKLVGRAFEENTKVIWSLLMDDEVSTIGIYGMGGDGKTTMLQHIHNELLQRQDICDHVWWVTVSQDFSINRLQNLIAKRLHLDLSSEDDDLHRAAKLSEKLRKKQKWILILDDLWNYFELDEVGIPVLLKGCKLIMTTRSETVCDRMACHHKIKVKPFFEGEAWTLARDAGRMQAGVQAMLMIMNGGNKRHKSIASSSNVNDYAISTCPQEQDNAVLVNLAGDAGRMQAGVQGMEYTGEGSFQHVDRSVSPWRLRVDAYENRGEATPGTDVVDQFVDGTSVQIHSALSKERLHDGSETIPRTEQVQHLERGISCETRGVPLPTSSTKPVGQAFEENTKEIWSLLMDDEVPTIGIYGMGGVGKTTILKHIHNELLQRPDVCDHVWWVTVSQDFSINRLQNIIAKRLHLDLSSEDDDLHRAAKLSEELIKKQKWILILDDLWNNFELDEVGIPIPLKGCNLIMTTRSETVCHRMACHHKIKVKPLSEGEAWTLFIEKLGRDIALSSEVEGIAKDIARECAGLPLGIITMAGSLMGVDDLHEWRSTLKKLSASEFRDKKLFKLLKFSYERLGDSALQKCLLYCALFPEDHRIKREQLIGYLIDEGIIKGKRSRGDAFDEGNTMLNRLEYVCLLESAQMGYDDIRGVKMHDLIRDMAIQILQDESQVMIKAGAQLKELPDAEEWTQNLRRVSLMQNKIEEIPSSYSPRCPYLSTLFLRDNKGLRFVADSFFKQLPELKVLDLSWTGIENLPDSVSGLVSLTALLLRKCDNLRYVPSLKKLRALKRLDLSRTRLEKMPQGMECLTNLRYLRMNGYGEKEFPNGILPKLSHLQVFVQEQFMPQDDAPITVKGKEVGSLRNLETLECHFEGFSEFVEYLRSRDGILSLSTYKILVGEVARGVGQCTDGFPSKTVGLGNLSINGDRDFQVKFLNGIQGLFCECIDARSLCDVLSLENATELERINIRECHNMESLVSSSWFCSAPPRLPSCNGTFSGLKRFFCYDCKSMKKLFPLVLLPNLVNLERIRVSFCEKMEEIIGTTDEESSTSNSITEVILPKLIALELVCLPELKSICSAKLICNSLEDIDVTSCEKLKRMSICLPLLENGQPSPPPSLKEINAYPKQWWETVVEWEHPNAKDVLRPFVK